MLVVCAWCEEHVREKEPLYDKSTSHSICDECYEMVKDEIKRLNSQKENHQYLFTKD
jgi:hypothetical protein